MGTPSSGEDEVASLLRRSHISPGYDHDLRFDSRNSEDVHKDALAAALAEHERIRDIAIRAYQLNEAWEAKEKLRLHALQEEERIRIETEHAEEECRLRDIENKARQIPRPAPLVPRAATPPPIETPKPPPPSVEQPTHSQPARPATQAEQPPVQTRQHTPPNSFQARGPAPANSFPTSAQPPSNPVQAHKQPPKSPTPFQASTGLRQPAAPPVKAAAPPLGHHKTYLLPGTERYAEIHRNLKLLRRRIVNAGGNNPAFKKKAGDMRRSLRMVLGQLTIGGKGVNKPQADKASSILLESLTSVPSEGVDPGDFMRSKPEPNPEARNNDDQLPSLFLFLLNHFSKAVVEQFVQEAGADPKAAGPLGMLVATVFSNPHFLWRGKSLIDILMAKMWKVCPVLFGARGSEKTEQGRERLGWKRDGEGDWVPEQTHNERMTGLGAGYAAISLRDFRKATSLRIPWPPYHYWQTMASIVSTPPEEASATQYNVLKAIIENSEGRFMELYGSAARAALRVALVDFPERALDQKSAAVNSLKVLADKLERDQGLMLRGTR